MLGKTFHRLVAGTDIEPTGKAGRVDAFPIVVRRFKVVRVEIQMVGTATFSTAIDWAAGFDDFLKETKRGLGFLTEVLFNLFHLPEQPRYPLIHGRCQRLVLVFAEQFGEVRQHIDAELAMLFGGTLLDLAAAARESAGP